MSTISNKLRNVYTMHTFCESIAVMVQMCSAVNARVAGITRQSHSATSYKKRTLQHESAFIVHMIKRGSAISAPAYTVCVVNRLKARLSAACLRAAEHHFYVVQLGFCE